jgi:hypothetical protein
VPTEKYIGRVVVYELVRKAGGKYGPKESRRRAKSNAVLRTISFGLVTIHSPGDDPGNLILGRVWLTNEFLLGSVQSERTYAADS